MPQASEQDRVAELDRLLRTTQETEARLRRSQSLATLALVAVFVGAVGAMVMKAREMYTVERFQAALPEQVEMLRPDIERTAREVAAATAPHYVRMGQDRLEHTLPALGAAVRVELDGMSASLAQRAERKVSSTLSAIQKKQTSRLQALYPDLDAQELARLRHEWAKGIQKDTERVLVDFHDRAMVDFTVLGATIESFDPNRFSEMEKEELVRYYAHLWVSLIDDQIVSGMQEGGAR